MRTIILLVILILSSITITFGGDLDFKATFNVTPGGTLNLNSDYGEVVVKVWNKNEVLVLGEGVSEEGTSNFTADQRGNSVYIVFTNSVKWGDYIKFVITVPSHFNLNLSTAAGEITILDQITGNHVLFTAGGDIRGKNINGGMNASTSGGDIVFGNVLGECTLKTAGGDIQVKDVKGKANFLTSGGNIVCGNFAESATLGTAGGDILVRNVAGGANFKTAGGNIKVASLQGSSVLTTAGGSLMVDAAIGKINAKTSAGEVLIGLVHSDAIIKTSAGEVEIGVAATNTGKINIQNSSGDVEIRIPPTLKSTIKGTVTSFDWGDLVGDEIKSDYLVASKKSGGKVNFSCVLNGGGGIIDINVSMGELRIKKY
ncbi:MAG: DUF4097 family beta strand repeat protein [Ignavibacteriales bacterium]|jgi:DUF4097 and DUF4098 domain-containing protein YvlB|nr:DUF4097 family beta strand repeat protein [Ignavibacteriales bacterium]MBK7267646.1 DUF4097 family beta strand repeat protein [Ignavibacteriales bacterium]MBP7542290.1 DUF4097 family beta strand repeat protein [Ignavibacteriaceae bacterium]MBP9123666.1 DUF4097 family beta strand repeat protein [Ignavibacteriaceae bacterium]